MNTRREILKYCTKVRHHSIEGIISEIEKNLLKNFDKDQNNSSYKITNLVYLRLVTTDEELKWSKDDYIKFKYAAEKLDDSNVNYVLPSYFTILTASFPKILEDLNYLASSSDCYPELCRKYNQETKRYDTTKEEITVTDSWKVIYMFQHRIEKFLQTTAELIYEKTDSETSYQIIYEIYYNGTKKEKNKFLYLFDSEFKFLENSFICRHIYHEYREKYFLCILNKLRQINELRQLNALKQIRPHKSHQAIIERKKEKKAEYDYKRKIEGRR